MIFFDDFDGGNTGEGVWTPSVSSNTVSGGDPGNCLRIPASVEYNRETNDYASLTLFFNLKTTNSIGFANIIDLRNALPSSFSGIAVAQVAIENDHSVSVYTSGTLIANSGTAASGFTLESDTWYFFQLNIEIQDVVVLGIHKVEVKVGLAVDGETLFSGQIKTIIVTATLPTASAVINLWRFRTGDVNYYYDNITVEGLVSFNDFPNPGSPIARVTQAAIEIRELPDDGAARMSQGAIEVPELPDNSNARITQMVIELIGTFVRSGTWRIYEA